LHDQAKELTPAYSYSGYVIVVLIVFCEERGITLPKVDRYGDGLKQNGGIMSIITQSEAASLHEKLTDLSIAINDDELSEYYNNFTEDNFDEAGEAMREAIEFLIRGCEMITSPDLLLILSVG